MLSPTSWLAGFKMSPSSRRWSTTLSGSMSPRSRRLAIPRRRLLLAKGLTLVGWVGTLPSFRGWCRYWRPPSPRSPRGSRPAGKVPPPGHLLPSCVASTATLVLTSNPAPQTSSKFPSSSTGATFPSSSTPNASTTRRSPQDQNSASVSPSPCGQEEVRSRGLTFLLCGSRSQMTSSPLPNG